MKKAALLLMILVGSFCLSVYSADAENIAVNVSKEWFDTCARIFPGSTVWKYERKQHVQASDVIFLFLPPGGWKWYDELTLRDPSGNKFKAMFSSRDGRFSAEKHKSPISGLPQPIQAELEKKVGVMSGETLIDVKIEPVKSNEKEPLKHLYTISGKINGQKVKTEIQDDGTVVK